MNGVLSSPSRRSWLWPGLDRDRLWVDTSTADRRQALEDYVAQVQPIRLGINELLDKADPVLEGTATES